MSQIGQLNKKILITGTIRAVTGLHIGGSNPGFAIGGADATVVRNPLTSLPYIPGSSLKGKMRSLIERLEGKWTESGITKAGPYVRIPDDLICQIFGLTPEDLKGREIPIGRIIVRDCEMSEESAKKLAKIKTDMPYTEIKTEVVIDRVTAKATPRQLERVPAGAVFNMRIVLNIFEGDNEKELLNKIFESLCLVQNDTLGGKGSRGSGEVAIQVKSVQYKDNSNFKANEDWQKYTELEIPEPLRHDQSSEV